MSLRALDRDRLNKDFIPQAVLSMSEGELRRRVDLIHDCDDFDEFVGGAFLLDDETEFALKHYAGHPGDTITVYLPPDITNVDVILRVVHRIVAGLDTDEKAILWDRSKDPDL